CFGNACLQSRVYYPSNENSCLQTCVFCASLGSMDKSSHATPVRRSQPARDRILEAARQIFGREGYEHATIRAIAAEAQINRSEERRVGKECRSRCDWSSDVCSSDLQPARDRILEAARQIFGREGYEHATIRAIAAEAQIN